MNSSEIVINNPKNKKKMKQKDFKTKPLTKLAVVIVAFLTLSVSTTLPGQVAVNNDGSQADPTAILDI